MASFASQSRNFRSRPARRFVAAMSAVFTAASISAMAEAQPADLPIAAATTDRYPPGVHVGTSGHSSVYVDGKGRVLYGMDMRTLMRFGSDPSQHCTGACAETWEPLLALEVRSRTFVFPQALAINSAAPKQKH